MRKIALLFPGQGAQYVGMGKKVYNEFAAVRQVFEEANDVLGFDLKKLCFEGELGSLTNTENAQPAILTTSIAMFKAFEQHLEYKPTYSAGHSLGEFTALTSAGVLSFLDALKIVRQRGIFMRESASLGIGSMCAVRGMTKEQISSVCESLSRPNFVINISNYNSNDQIVISGHKEAVDKAAEEFIGLGGKITPLNVSAAFHSPLMMHAADRLKVELSKYHFNIMQWEVLSNVTGKPHISTGQIIGSLVEQMIKPVQWTETMNFMSENEIEVAIELGPGKILTNLMSRNAPSIETFAFDYEENMESLFSKVAAVRSKKEKFISKCIVASVCTKNRNDDSEIYENGVIKPYRELQKMEIDLKERAALPSVEDMKNAINLLITIFETKKVPNKEKHKRFNLLLKETGTREELSLFLQEYIQKDDSLSLNEENEE